MRTIDAKSVIQDHLGRGSPVEVTLTNPAGGGRLVINTGLVLGEITITIAPGETRRLTVAAWVAESLRGRA